MTDDETIVRHRLRVVFDDRAPATSGGPADREPGGPAVSGGSGGDVAAAAGGVAAVHPSTVVPTGAAPERTAGIAPAPVARLGGGVFDPGRRGVRGLAAVARVVALGAGWWAWRARPATEPVPVAPVAGDTGSSAGTSGPADGGTPVPGTDLVVTVAGKVRRPGLVRLPAGARLADAIDAAGGALPGVDVAMLNPARRLTDGELVVVGVAPPAAGAGQPAAGGPPDGTVPGATGGRVNLNTATLAQLDALPGVGPVLAQRILDHRQRHGPFRAVTDLRQVDGIGEARYEDLKDLVTV